LYAVVCDLSVLDKFCVKAGTPTMGGLVFVLVVALITVTFNRSREQTLFPLFVACLAGLLGLLEDFTKVYRKSGLPGFFEYHFAKLRKFFITRRSLPGSVIFYPWRLFKEFWRIVGSSNESGIQTYQKFIFQALIAGFVAYWTYIKLGWDYIWFPLMGDVHLGLMYPIIIFFFFLMVLNFVAFTDGLDGLAGGLSLYSFAALWIIAVILGYNSLGVFCAVFIGALIPFLYFNVFPARVFMGNVGSHVLGAVFVVLAIVMHREVILLLVLAPFLVDGVTSPLQQLSVKLTGKRIFRMAPVHHHFELLGWHESKVTLRFYLFGIVSSLLGILTALM
jgi:phospho-N-acetylmuramoyl-pentapeptide-transferase